MASKPPNPPEWKRSIFDPAYSDYAETFDADFKRMASHSEALEIDHIQQKYGLPPGSGYFVYEAFVRLRRAKKVSSHYPYTGAERSEALSHLAACCEELNRALAKVWATDDDGRALEVEFVRVASERTKKNEGRFIEAELLAIVEKRKATLPPHFGPNGSPLEILEGAASACEVAALCVRENIPGYGKQGGRRPTMDSHSLIVEDLFLVALHVGMRPRGGAFRGFCDAVFEMAGIPGNSEGAIRHFAKTRWPAIERVRLDGGFGVIPKNGKKPSPKPPG
jgi:hypothetical protein